ncbi:MAG TPA: MBL fold metallo-hydrolase [Chloroflexota bacterium]|nr:MBL fold metallo-hydrolase [Chloroflexota bacterium]
MGDGRITVGNVEISHLYDLVADFPLTLDQLYPTVPAEAWEPYRRDYPELFGPGNTWRYHAGCYLIRSQGQTILVDTGVGPSSMGLATWIGTGGALPDRLRAAGVAPEDVETVVFTHLHPDHVGWNLQPEDGRYRPTFPRARYLAHRADWETFHLPEVQQAMEGVAPGYVPQSLTPLEGLGALDLTDGERSMTSEVTAIHTPGHTPGSITLLIASGDQRAILVGDAIAHPAQVEHPDWGFAFDFDGETAQRTRGQLLDRIEAEGLIVSACHFPEPGFGRVVRLEGRRSWRAL